MTASLRGEAQGHKTSLTVPSKKTKTKTKAKKQNKTKQKQKQKINK